MIRYNSLFFSLIFSLFLFKVEFTVGQVESLNSRSIAEPSADAYSLSKYGFLPVNKYTGSALISIPLYSIQFGDLPLQLNLNYSQNGLRVNEDASLVGLGWSITSTGIITRKINDTDDFMVKGDVKGWINQPNLNLDYNSDPLYIPPLPGNLRYDIENSQINCGKPDTEPDLFSVNIFGRTFKFILVGKASNGGVVGVKNLDNMTYKVSFNEATTTFDIIDEIGYKYVFGTKEYSRSGTISTNGDSERGLFPADFDSDCTENITSWYLDQIVSPENRILTFNYRIGQERYSTPASLVGRYQSQFCGETPNEVSIVGSKSVISCVYLNSITNGDESIIFSLDTREDLAASSYNFNFSYPNEKPKRLTAITISYKGIARHTISLSQSYFDQDKLSEADKWNFLRLKLDAVNVMGRTYRFDYNLPNSLPSKLSRSVDFWGFYNGKTNAVRYPSAQFNYPCDVIRNNEKVRVNGANLEADFNFSKISGLNRITYPTGGYTNFEYEANTVKRKIDEFYFLEAPEYKEQFLEKAYSSSVTEPTEYSFDVAKDLVFNGSQFSSALLNYRITKSNRAPSVLFKPDDPNRDKLAIQLLNTSTNAIVFSMTFAEYITYCYDGSNPVCSLQSTECYCMNVDRYFSGTLTPGNYKLKLFAVPQLDTKVTLRIPLMSLPYAPPYRNKEVGGLRIKTISDYDFGGEVVSRKTYKYTDKATSYSSGLLMSMPNFISFKKYFSYDGGESLPRSTLYAMVSSSSNSPISFSAGGSHIGYDTVEEIFESTTDSQKNFKNVTKFANRVAYQPPIQVKSVEDPIPFQPYQITDTDAAVVLICVSCNPFSFTTNVSIESAVLSGFDMYNGKVISETSYNNYGQIVKNSDFFYKNYNNGYIGGIKFSLATWTNLVGTNRKIDVQQKYFHKIEDFLLDSVRTTTYSASTSISETQKISYDAMWQKKVESTIQSDGSVLKTLNYYPYDYSILSNLNSKNIIGIPIKKEVVVDGNLVNGEVKELNSNGLVSKIYKYESSTLLPVQTHDPTALLPNGYQSKANFTYYDDSPNQGNIKESVSNDGLVVTYLWGYNGNYLVGKIVGATYSVVASIVNKALLDNAGSTSDNNALMIELNKLRDSPVLRGLNITTYTYSPGFGIASKTDANGSTQYYEYDELGRLQYIKDNDHFIIQKFNYHFIGEN